LLQKGGTVVSEVYFTEGDKMAKETKKEKQKINIDGTEYDSDQLSDKAKNIIGFVQKIDKEATELRFQLDKVTLARKQAVIDLQEEIK
jgi:hypothetical protein